MVNSTFQKLRIPIVFSLLFILASSTVLKGQTRTYATNFTGTNVKNAAFAADGNLNTAAEVEAYAGLALGLGAYSGTLQLGYTSLVPANTTTFVRIDTEDDLLRVLLGGGLGELLDDVLGIVLIGNQEFTIEAFNNTGGNLSAVSTNPNSFDTDAVRVVTDAAGNLYIAIKPTFNYTGIRITNRVGALVGLGNTKTLDVRGAFYASGSSICNEPAYTAFDGNGLSLDLLQLGGAGVDNPENAIDNDPTSFSELSLGVLDVAASIEQAVYFDTASQPTEDFKISLKVDPTLLALGVLNNIQFEAYNGTTLVSSSSLSSLLNLDLLGLLQSNAVAQVPFNVSGPADRIVIRYNSLLGVNLFQRIEFYDIAITPGIPVIDVASQNSEVCAGDTASLVATTNTPGAELRWYTSVSGGTPLATVASGDSFATPALTGDTTFYVASFLAGCTEESARIPVRVTVNPLPESGDITVLGLNIPICIPEILNIVPATLLNGTFKYYLDANGDVEITNGLVQGDLTYTINADGELEVEGLTEADSSYRVYISLVDAVTGCENAPGDLKVVDVTFDGGPEPTISLNPVTADNIINAAEASGTITLSGSVGGDAEVGDPVIVTVNTFEYSTTVVTGLLFSVDVNAAQLVADDDLTIEAKVTAQNGLFCETTISTTQVYTVDVINPSIPTVDFLITNDNTPTTTGTADSVDNLMITVDGVTYAEGDGNLTDNGDDTWSLSIPAGNALADATYDVVAVASDSAGNTSTDGTTNEVIIDTTVPTVPTVNNQETSDTTPTVTGTATSADVLNVALNGVTYTEGDGNLVDNGNNTWTLNVPAGNELIDGTYDLAVIAIDTAGNSSIDTTTDELVINTMLPTTPMVVAQVTNITSPTITGTADSTDDLTVTVNGVIYAETGTDLTDNGNNTWTLVIPVTLAEGVYNVTATATQGIQSATDPTSGELTIDLTAPTEPTVDFLTTNDTTPTLTGTSDSSAALMVVVNGVSYNKGDGNLTDNGNNTWSLTIPSALVDGIYDVMATATDLAGNASIDATTNELTIDTAATTRPTVNLLVTNDTTPMITGTAVFADNLKVSVDGVTYTEGDGKLIDNGNNTWSLTIPAGNALADGTYDVMATATDAAGNVSIDATTNELTIDTVAPTRPTVDFLTTNDTTPTITGTANSVDNLTVSVDGVIYNEGDGNLTDNGNNTWSLTIPAGNVLGDGTYDVVATATDAVGNTTIDATTDELTIDTVAPTAPTVDFLTTSDTTPRITGTVDSTTDLTVTVSGVTYNEGDGNLTDNGDDTWTLNIPVALTDGTYDVVATSTNALGNISTDATTDELIIDSTLCNAPVFTTVNVNGLGLLGAGVTNPDNAIDGDPATFSQLNLGVVSVAASVQQSVYFATATQATEDFEISLKISPALLALGVANNIQFQAYNGTSLVSSSNLSSLLNLDLLGLLQSGAVAAIPFNVSGPADRVVVRLSSLLGVSTAQNLGLYDISITSGIPVIDSASQDVEVCEGSTADLVATTTTPGAELRWYDAAIDGNLLGTVASGATFTTPTLTEDTLFYVASFLAGCTEESGRVAVTVTVNPLPESGDITVLGLNIPICIPEILNIVPATLLNGTFKYYLDANGDVEITNGLVQGDLTYTINADGELEVEGLTQADSPYRVYISLVDAVTGCENAPGDLKVVDVTFDGGSEPTISLNPVTADNIINAAEASGTITLSGIVGGDAEVGDSVIVTVNTFEYSTTVVTGLLFSVDVNGAQLVADDDLTVEAKVTAQNLLLCETTISTTQVYTLDLINPTTPTVDFLTTNDNTPAITGTADSVDNLMITVDGVTYAEGDGNLTDNGDDTWSLTIPAGNALADATYDVVAVASDSAGNTSTDGTTNELTIDTTVPTVPTVDFLTTSDTTPTLTGTADSVDNLRVTVDGVAYTEGDGNLMDNGNNTWRLAIPVANALADGIYEVVAVASDAAGNSSSDVTTNELIIDPNAPTVPTVDFLTTNDTTPTITGTLDSDDDLMVVVNGITYVEGDANLTDNGDDTWSLNITTALAEGVYDVIATATDAASNSSTDTTVDELTIDITAPTIPLVDFLTTNDNTPTITGTANSVDNLTVTVNGVTYTEDEGNLTDNGDDTFTLVIPAGDAIPDGTYDVVATATDAAGNSSSDLTTDELTIDTMAPTVPTVNPLVSNSNTPTITGTADSADALTVTVNGVTYAEGDGNLTDNGDDTFTLVIPAGDAIPDGIYDVVAIATDAAGNSSSDLTTDELTIDTMAPTVPTVNPLISNSNTPTITGTADSADDLTVTVNGVTYTEGDGNLTDNGNDTFTLVIPSADAIPDGIYDVVATATDTAGNSSTDTTTDELTIDTMSPTVPTVNPLVSNSNTPTITGTADSADALTVTVNEVTYTEGDGNLTDNGDDTFTLVIPAGDAIPDGTYDVVATATDTAGNSSTDTTTDELTIDTMSPTVPTVNPLVSNTNTPTITGTADSADTLTVTVNGVSYTEGDGNLTDNGDDTFTLVIPAGNEIPDGIYDVVATATDTAGNYSTDTTTDELTIDTMSPTVPTVNPLVSNSNTPTITGTADSADDLTVTVNGVTYSEGDGNLTDNGDDTFTLVIPAGDAIPDGTYNVVATATDAAGNFSTDTTTDELTIDTKAPTVPTVNPLVSNSNTPTITGTADSADALTVTVNGVTYTEGDGNLTDNGDDTFTLIIPAGDAIPDGTYDVIATATDAAGNSSTDTTTDELTIDTMGPTVPTVDFLTTNDTTPTITGTAVSVDNLVIVVNGVTYKEGDGNLTDNGDGTFTLVIPVGNEIPDGTYNVVAIATDAAGNTSIDLTTDELIIDATAPTVPTVDPLVTDDNTPILTGTADSVDDLIVIVNGITYTEGDGNLVDNGDNTWTLTIPAGNALADGTYDVMVTVTDSVGNTSMDVTIDELTIDTSTLNQPTIPTVISQTTSDSTPIITGTADSPDVLMVSVNGFTYTEADGNLVDNGNNTWTLTIPAGSEIPQGTYNVVASVTNSFGNTLTDVTTDELTISVGSPTGDTDQSFCASDMPTLADIVLNTTSIKWYAQLTGGVALSLNEPLVNGKTYFAALVVGSFESALRLPVNITLTQPVVATLQASSNTGCLGAEITYTTQPGMIDYFWTVGAGGRIVAGGTDQDNSITVVWDVEGTQNVSVDYLSNDACLTQTSASLDLSITACSDLAIAKTVNIINPAIGEQIVYTITVSNTGQVAISDIDVSENLPSGLEFVSFTASVGNYNNTTGRWNIPTLGSNETATLTVTVTVLDTGNYLNIARILSSSPVDANLDNNSAELEIDPDCLMVFNEFSPNGDGMNDVFTIRCIEKYPNNNVKVFNRVGHLVYEASNYLNTWNGDSNSSSSIQKSKGLPAGTYYYVLEINDSRSLTGWVYIAR